MNGIKMVLLSGNENVPLFQQENETSSFQGDFVAQRKHSCFPTCSSGFESRLRQDFFLTQFVKKIEIEPVQFYAVNFTNAVQNQAQQKVGYFTNAGMSLLGYLGYTHSMYIQQCHMTTGLQRFLKFHIFKAIRYLTSTRQRMKQLQNCHKSNIIFQSKVGQALYVRTSQVLLMQNLVGMLIMQLFMQFIVDCQGAFSPLR